MTRAVVYVRNSTDPIIEGSRSIPHAQGLRPNESADKLESWFKAGWRVHSVGGYAPSHTQGVEHRHDLTVMVLEHDGKLP